VPPVYRARRISLTLALGVVLIGAVDVGWCGDSTNGSVAVQVGHVSITQATVKHWMEVIAGEVSTTPPQPKPSVPAPPKYSACIAYKRKYPVAPASGKPTPFQLRRECAFEFEKEKLKALYFLISSEWIDGAARETGVLPAGPDLRRQLIPLEQRFPNKAVARRFLVGVRGTEADLFARLKGVFLISKVQQKVEAESRRKGLDEVERQRALDEFSQRFESRWRARTACRPGYVVPICKQRYRPPKFASTLSPPNVPLTKMTAE
jgi:hypothetical protein